MKTFLLVAGGIALGAMSVHTAYKAGLHHGVEITVAYYESRECQTPQVRWAGR